MLLFIEALMLHHIFGICESGGIAEKECNDHHADMTDFRGLKRTLISGCGNWLGVKKDIV